MLLATSKLFSLVVLFIGELLAVYAEMVAARAHAASQPFIAVFIKMLLLITIAGGFLVASYMLGYASFKNIWIVTVASITMILIVEPVLAYTMFHELPTKGAAIGLALGVVGFLATILVK